MKETELVKITTTITVISRRNLPVRLPVWQTVTCWLLLDRLHADHFWWGSAALLFLIIWGACVWAAFKQKEIDIFDPDQRVQADIINGHAIRVPPAFIPNPNISKDN